jgi:hypothetical protein
MNSKNLGICVFIMAATLAFSGLCFGGQNGSSQAPVDPNAQSTLRLSLQTTGQSADQDAQFLAWQRQRTSADPISLFKCSASTDLDSPECVGAVPGNKVTGTKDAKTPTTLPLSKEIKGEPDCPGLAGKSKTNCSGIGGELVKPETKVRDKSGKSSPAK